MTFFGSWVDVTVEPVGNASLLRINVTRHNRKPGRVKGEFEIIQNNFCGKAQSIKRLLMALGGEKGQILNRP